MTIGTEVGTVGSSTAGNDSYMAHLSKVLPEPGDPIMNQWFIAVTSFSWYRFARYATFEGTLADGTFATFNYAALRCDNFPPVLTAYVRGSSGVGTWNIYEPWNLTWNQYGGSEWYGTLTWRDTTLLQSVLENNTGTSQVILMMAYM